MTESATLPPRERRPLLSLKNPPAAALLALKQAAKLRKKAKQAAAAQRFVAVHRLLRARWPLIFSWGRPLAIGIDQQVRAALTEEELSTRDFQSFMHRWVKRPAYRAALERGDPRVNLDGSIQPREVAVAALIRSRDNL